LPFKCNLQRYAAVEELEAEATQLEQAVSERRAEVGLYTYNLCA
jgi:hypothetical protein